MKLVAIVLTLNEDRHLARCLTSVGQVTSDILVVDCFSTDRTLEIAREHGARVVQKPWVNHAEQFNWALTQLQADTDWVLRIDADEYLTSELVEQIRSRLPAMGLEIQGVYCARRMAFQRRLIRHGGVFPVYVLRLFRLGTGRCEQRWMDEHIQVQGGTTRFDAEIIDDSLHSLHWWTDKHNRYASREVVDILNLQYRFMPMNSVARLVGGSQAGVKRWIKENLYGRLPMGFRALVYFVYRYFIRLGFLDGPEGTAFHVLQGFWYRFLVDAKLREVRRHMEQTGCDAPAAILAVLDVKVDPGEPDASNRLLPCKVD